MIAESSPGAGCAVSPADANAGRTPPAPAVGRSGRGQRLRRALVAVEPGEHVAAELGALGARPRRSAGCPPGRSPASGQRTRGPAATQADGGRSAARRPPETATGRRAGRRPPPPRAAPRRRCPGGRTSRRRGRGPARSSPGPCGAGPAAGRRPRRTRCRRSRVGGARSRSASILARTPAQRSWLRSSTPIRASTAAACSTAAATAPGRRAGRPTAADWASTRASVTAARARRYSTPASPGRPGPVVAGPPATATNSTPTGASSAPTSAAAAVGPAWTAATGPRRGNCHVCLLRRGADGRGLGSARSPVHRTGKLIELPPVRPSRGVSFRQFEPCQFRMARV